MFLFPFRAEVKLLRAPLLIVLALALVLGPVLGVMASPPDSASSASLRSDHVPDQFLVKFKPGTPDDVVRSINALNAVKERRTIPRIGVYVLAVPKGKTARDMVARYAKNPNVEFAEVDQVVSVNLTPDDPLFSGQWGLPAVFAPQAWDITTGSSAIVVAIVDTGIDASHPDLAGKLVAGYDFVNRDADPVDDHGHGTLVAGIAGANSNNGVGIAGANWGARLMPLKVLDSTGSGSMSTVAEGIIWATDRGARIINMSLSGPSGTSTLESAVKYAYGKGAVLVAAAGNTGTDTPRFPAAYPEVIAVGSLSGDTLSSYSSYGSHISVVAPGGLIYSTRLGGDYTRASGTSMAAPFVAGLAAMLVGADPTLTPASVERLMQETATDLGTAGFDVYYGHGRIDMSTAIRTLAAPAPAPEPEPEPEPTSTPAPAPTPPADVTPPVVAITSPADGTTISGRVTIAASASDDTGVTKVDFYIGNTLASSDTSSPYSWTWDTRKLSGTYVLTAIAYDAAGNFSTSQPVTVNVSSTTGRPRKR